MFILVLLGGFASLLSPILLNVWSGDDVGFTKGRILILLVVLLSSLILEVIFTIFREKFAKEFNIGNFKSMINKFFLLDYDEINDKGPTNLVERIVQAVNNIYIFMTGDYVQIWTSALIMIVILGMVVIKSKIIASIMFITIPINYFGYKSLNKELSKRSEVLQKETAAGWQQILSITGQTDYLKQCDSYENIIEQMEPSLNKIYGIMADVNVLAQSASKVIISLNGIIQTMIMVLVVYQMVGDISLILFTILMPLYFYNLSIITRSNLNKRDMNISLEFIKEWDSKLEDDGHKDIDSIQEIILDIDELSIKGKHLASNIKGVYKKGDIVWIKGESGTGKSTLAKLFPKFRTIDSIYINGMDIRDIKNESLRAKVDYFSQNVPIIKGTLRENLFFNKAYDANIEDKLRYEPILQSVLKTKSMDTLIGEGGANLSGGEKQKIAISRGLYDERDLLILDEVTSNIDRESSEDIMNQILKDSQDRIVFIISHDSLPEKYANKIINLKL